MNWYSCANRSSLVLLKKNREQVRFSELLCAMISCQEMMVIHNAFVSSVFFCCCHQTTAPFGVSPRGFAAKVVRDACSWREAGTAQVVLVLLLNQSFIWELLYCGRARAG